jgi:hypothetical protein
MLNFAPVEAWQPSVVDTFERTSSGDLLALREQLKSNLSNTESEFLTMLNRFDIMRRSLNQLASIPDNWNQYGSPAPSARSIVSARQVLDSLQSESLVPRRVLPSAEGGVAFVYLSETENRAVIESLNDDEIFILLYDRRGNSKTLDWSESRLTQQNLLRELRDHLRGTNLAAS